jgi:hypothetical protein
MADHNDGNESNVLEFFVDVKGDPLLNQIVFEHLGSPIQESACVEFPSKDRKAILKLWRFPDAKSMHDLERGIKSRDFDYQFYASVRGGDGVPRPWPPEEPENVACVAEEKPPEARESELTGCD